MWEKIADFIRLIEPIILIIIPLLFGIWIKLKTKMMEEKTKIETKINNKTKEEFDAYRHEESIKVINKLKEVCNYHCDIGKVHTSFVQLENGTIATSKICNMFFSCVAEDNRYSKIRKLIDCLQRVPFTRLSNWFNSVCDSEYQTVFLMSKEQIGDLYYDMIGIRCMVSGLVRDSKGYIIGVCNFMFDEDKDVEELKDKYEAQMLKFVSSIETVFLDYNINLDEKKKELNMIEGEE